MLGFFSYCTSIYPFIYIDNEYKKTGSEEPVLIILYSSKNLLE